MDRISDSVQRVSFELKARTNRKQIERLQIMLKLSKCQILNLLVSLASKTECSFNYKE